MNWSSFTLKDGDRTLASPSIEIVAISYDSAAANGKGLDHGLRAFERRFGKQLEFLPHWRYEGCRPVDAKTLAGPYSWCKSEKILATKMLGFFPHLLGMRTRTSTHQRCNSFSGASMTPRFMSLEWRFQSKLPKLQTTS